MDAVTYPDQRVSSLIQELFVPVKLNVADSNPSVQNVVHKYGNAWTPTFMFITPKGAEARRMVGYIPPDDMMVNLLLGAGQAQLAQKHGPQGLELIERAVREFPDSQLAPEALFWFGVAGYKAKGTKEDLLGPWNQLRQKFPNSEWWTRASFIAG